MIQDNRATYGCGGGVYSNGTFRKKPKEAGGTSDIIYGSNESDAKLRNTATFDMPDSGHAVLAHNGRIVKETTAGETTSLASDSPSNWDGWGL